MIEVLVFLFILVAFVFVGASSSNYWIQFVSLCCIAMDMIWYSSTAVSYRSHRKKVVGCEK